jgi:hypothetical protein
MTADHTQHVSRDETARRPRRRRRRLLAFGLFFALIIGVPVVIVVAIWLRLPKHTAAAYFQVASREPAVAFESARDDTGREFQIYRDTQAQLIKSGGVLTAALREPDLANLAIVQRGQKKYAGDAVAWLEKDLQVSFPGDAEIMEVSLAGDDPEELTHLLNAVVRAYEENIGRAEQSRRADRLNELDRIYVDKRDEVKAKMNQIRQLAEQLLTGDPETQKLKQEVALRRLSDIRTEHYRVQTQLELTRGALKAQQTLLALAETAPIPPADVEDYVASHPLMRELSAQLAGHIRVMADSRVAAKRDAASSYVDKYADNAHAIEVQIAALKVQAETKLRDRLRAETEKEVRRLQVEVEVLAGREQRLAEEVRQEENTIQQASRTSVDLEMQQREVQRLKESLDQIGRARDRLTIELQARSPRVRLLEAAQIKK